MDVRIGYGLGPEFEEHIGEWCLEPFGSMFVYKAMDPFW